MTDEAILEAFVDIKAEIAAIQQALLSLEIPTLSQAGMVEDQQIGRESLRNALLLKYPDLAPASGKSFG